MSLKLNIDVASLASQFKELAIEAERELMAAVEILSKRTHGHVLDSIANGEKKLNSSLTLYQENLSKPDPVSYGIWVITLDEPAMWIEEGTKEYDMKPGLLKGAKYKVIPFMHNKRPQDRTKVDNMIREELATGLKEINSQRQKEGKPKINLNKLELGPDNKTPRLGKLHELDMKSSNPTASAKHPALKGLAIYQNKDEVTGKVSRDVMTFRTVSVNSDPTSWQHPAFVGKKFFDDAFQWAMNEWENKILPEIMSGAPK